MGRVNREKVIGTKCKHMGGLLCGGNTICKAGVDVRELVGGKNFGWLARIPCNTIHQSDITCEKFAKKSQEDIDREEAGWQKLIEKINIVDPLVSQLKAKFKDQDSTGFEECPICKGSLVWQISSYNGHMRMKCNTDNCINFIE